MNGAFAEPVSEPSSDEPPVGVVPRHAEVQGLGSAEREPRVEGAGNGSSRIVNEL